VLLPVVVCVTQAGSLAQNCGVTSLLDMADLLGCDPSPGRAALLR
jgi:hypothetical protein